MVTVKLPVTKAVRRATSFGFFEARLGARVASWIAAMSRAFAWIYFALLPKRISWEKRWTPKLRPEVKLDFSSCARNFQRALHSGRMFAGAEELYEATGQSEKAAEWNRKWTKSWSKARLRKQMLTTFRDGVESRFQCSYCTFTALHRKSPLNEPYGPQFGVQAWRCVSRLAFS